MCATCVKDCSWIYKGGPLTESQCGLYYGRIEANSLTLTPETEDNVVTVIVVEVNSVLYDTDDGEETEESIRAMLAKAGLEESINQLDEEIQASLYPKSWEEWELFYNTTRVKLNHRRELVIGEKEKERMSYLRFIELRK